MRAWRRRVTYEDLDWEEMEPHEALEAVECALAWDGQGRGQSKGHRLQHGAARHSKTPIDSSSVCLCALSTAPYTTRHRASIGYDTRIGVGSP